MDPLTLPGESPPKRRSAASKFWFGLSILALVQGLAFLAGAVVNAAMELNDPAPELLMIAGAACLVVSWPLVWLGRRNA